MSSHPDIGPELRQLAQAILDRLDPAVRSAAMMATEALRGPGRCQQVWCPVCALAALISGEQHPLLNVVAEHSVALMSLLNTMAADPDAPPAERVSCTVGLVDALENRDANVLAREVADDYVNGFRCGVDKPVFHGKRGNRSGSPYALQD